MILRSVFLYLRISALAARQSRPSTRGMLSARERRKGQARRISIDKNLARDNEIYLNPRSRDRDLLQSETGPVKYGQNSLAFE